MTPHRGTDADQPHPSIIQVQTEQQLLHQRLESSLSAFAGHLSALQGDMQGVKAKLDTLAHAQQDFTHHSTAVDRLAKAIEKMATDNERRWEHHERENAATAKTVNDHATGLRIGWIAAILLATVLGWFGNSQVARVRERMDDHLAAGTETKRNYEARFQRIESDQRDLRSDLKAVKTP